MKKFIAIAALAAAFAAPSALADHHGGKKTFADLDTDASGALTLAEVQAAKPDFTAEKFAKYDTDANSEISQAEHEAWKAAKKDKRNAAKAEARVNGGSGDAVAPAPAPAPAPGARINE